MEHTVRAGRSWFALGNRAANVFSRFCFCAYSSFLRGANEAGEILSPCQENTQQRRLLLKGLERIQPKENGNFIWNRLALFWASVCI